MHQTKYPTIHHFVTKCALVTPDFHRAVVRTESYMACLKHVPLKHGNVNFPVWFPVRVCALNLLFINIFHDVVVRVESRCVIKAKHVLFCQFIRFCAGKTVLALKRSRIFPHKIERITRAARQVLLHTCAHFCYEMVYCGLWGWCIVRSEQQVYVRETDEARSQNINV